MGSTTTNLGLYKPSTGESGWGSLVDANFDTLDQPPSWTIVSDGGAAILTATGYATLGFGSVLQRHARGTKAAPTKTLNNDTLGRIGAMGAYDVAGVGTFPGAAKARIEFDASEDHNDSTHLGNFISLWTTPNASATPVNQVNFGVNGIAIQGVPTTDLSYSFGSSAGLVDTTISNPSMGWIARTTNADRNEGVLTIQGVFTTFSPTAQREKWGLAVKVATEVNSTSPNNFDAVPLLSQGVIRNGATTGRAWGSVHEAIVNTTSEDGLLIGAEFGIINHGSAQTAVDNATSKYNIWLASHMELSNPFKATAGLCFSSSTAGWHYGFFMRNIVNTFVVMKTPDGSSGSTIGIDIQNSANWKAALIAPNAAPIQSYDSGGTTPRNVLKLTSTDVLEVGIDTNVAEVKIGNAGTTKLGVFGHATTAQQTVTGSRSANAALASLLTALAAYGLIVDSSSA